MFQRKTGIGLLLEIVEIDIGKLVKIGSALFQKYYGINIFHVLIGKGFACFPTAYLFVLTKQQIGRVAGTSLAGECIADFLKLNIGNTAIFQLYYDIHGQQG